MTDAIDATQGASVNQADYLKLFMQELTYQDPLKPIDNREFMAQMAQFSALQEAQETSKALAFLKDLAYDNKGLMLLGRKVSLIGNETESFTVNKVGFMPNGAPIIYVLANGKSLAVQLMDISSVS
ncbi:flagellar basal body rod modification protein [Legionella massiliensis]|uniref:Basal-body rod modification protein FlgD n=1 Tax=Legionella massiliensis TaxID=1034943 RepID=A0A078KRK7_9GAMM|nr:flagellar hook capping FlgD N-terminal domain-containing protein [Legionella massiliensis]CDZ77055.1 flagellar basal body rod modification protein [Legionella massiliensis]CEE12793.1 flagellar basal body rod modification protein [Legionella massiliensis]